MEDGQLPGAELGFLSALVTLDDLAVYVRNGGTVLTAVITGGDADRRVALMFAIRDIARQPDFVFTDRTGRLRASIRSIGSHDSAWNGVRAGGATAPYSGYVESKRPFMEIASRIAVGQQGGETRPPREAGA